MRKSQPRFPHLEIFFIFLKLGCISFGGPAAHLVFFHQKFVKQLKWMTESEYAQMVALAQILPGPSSSQVGIAIGYVHQGYRGSISAWLGFTLPSFIFMTLAAMLGQYFIQYLSAQFFHVIHLIVLAIVIWAFWQMLQSFCKEIWQYILMLCSAFFIYSSSLDYNQVILIVCAGIVGLLFGSKPNLKKSKRSNSNNLLAQAQNSALTEATELKVQPLKVKNNTAYLWLLLFLLPFLITPIIQNYAPSELTQSIQGFYQSASMVFGGGHIILPLLYQDFVSSELISNQQFDLGYAIAQLMPGPLFSFASYLGALLNFTDSMFVNAMIATVIIFLPSFFLLWGTLPYWTWLMRQHKISQAVIGINAAVSGLLLCLVIQMSEKSVLSWMDFIFVGLVICLFKTKLPIAMTLLMSFFAYYGILLLF